VRICTIAGSDSGGGAGIQADLKTFLALGAYGLSAITALTAQNTRGVQDIHYPPVDFLRQQLKSVRDDIAVDGWKIGMLGNEDIISAVEEELKRIRGSHGSSTQPVPIVLDPVMVSTSGSVLLSDGAIDSIVTRLLPLCTLLTPNLPEAEKIIAHIQEQQRKGECNGNGEAKAGSGTGDFKTLVSRLRAAKYLSEHGPEAVLLKGGHQPLHRDDLQKELASLGLSYADSQSSEKTPAQEEYDCLSAGYEVTESSSQGDMAKITCLRADTSPYSLFLKTLIQRQGDRGQQEDFVMVDVLYDRVQDEYTIFVKGQVSRSCTHGTGCTLSSALAVHLAQQQAKQRGRRPVADALRIATWKSINYVHAAIIRGYEDLGSGPGALDHGVSLQRRGGLTSTAPGISELEYTHECSATLQVEAGQSLGQDPAPFTTCLLSRSQPLWNRYIGHPFVMALAQPGALREDQSLNSTQRSPLPLQSFLYYLKQDYHFLLAFSKVYSLASSLSRDFQLASFFNSLSKSMAHEASEHVSLCTTYFGMTSVADLQKVEEGTAVIAYTRYVLDLARGGGDLITILTATMPCLLGYADMALLLQEETTRLGKSSSKSLPISEASTSNSLETGLRVWLDGYLSEEYRATAQAGVALLEGMVAQDPPSARKMERLQAIWNKAVSLEIALWDECLAYPT
jgi:hydroxymethylpyrimidine/phosphomethylpyrimidine kinase